MSSNLSMQGLAGTVVSDGFVFAANGIECPAVCAPAVFVDASLLFSGHYDRVGLDLVISSGPESFTVKEYFKG
ncbi:hypothetical protein ABTM24_19975, partial [Acinetobacter baumannii]